MSDFGDDTVLQADVSASQFCTIIIHRQNAVSIPDKFLSLHR
jgi:hypothetical protein